MRRLPDKVLVQTPNLSLTERYGVDATMLSDTAMAPDGATITMTGDGSLMARLSGNGDRRRHQDRRRNRHLDRDEVSR